MKFIAHITKGLEYISENEILSLTGTRIFSTEHKLILFEYDGDVGNLKNLKTVDDIGIFIGEFSVDKLLSLDLGEEVEKIGEAISFLKSFREMKETYAVTLSKYKTPLIDDELFMNNLTLYLSRHLSYELTPRDHSNLDIRINITEDRCLLTIKLFSQSLYRRDYDHVNRLGSIRSTIAAAMLRELVGEQNKVKVVDILCGSGTILCEALSMGCSVYGNDHDIEAVQTTLENLNKIKRGKYNISNFDASNTEFKDSYFDIAISNFPWEKQVRVGKMDRLVEGTIREYSRILKDNSKIGLITTKPELIKKYLESYFEIVDIEEHKIGYQGQVPTIILADVRKLAVA